MAVSTGVRGDDIHGIRIINLEQARAVDHLIHVAAVCPPWFCEAVAAEIELRLPELLRPQYGRDSDPA